MKSAIIISSAYSQSQHIKELLISERYEIAGNASNSVQGMNMIEASLPDIVIMPTYMNFWNAEDLINYLLPRDIAPQFILLHNGDSLPSGALIEQVVTLIPEAFPTKKQLNEALTEADRKRRSFASRRSITPPEDSAILHSLEVMEILMGLTTPSLDNALIKYGRLHVGREDCWLILCAPAFENSKPARFISQFEELELVFRKIHELFAPLGRTEICIYQETDICILLTGKASQEPDWTLLCDALNRTLIPLGLPAQSIEVSDRPIPLMQWHSQCQELLEIRKKRFFYSPPCLSPKVMQDYMIPETQQQVREQLSHLLLAMQGSERSRVTGALRRLKTMIQHSLSEELYSFVSTQLIILYSRLRYSYSIQDPDGELHTSHFISVSDAFEAYEALFLRLYDSLNDLQGSCCHQIIRQVCVYINHHLSEPLSLETLAAQVHISSSYLSRLFKKETGCTFNVYVTKRRIDRATQLLETQYKITDIADMVGFENAKYFSQVFRKYTGQTPLQYRQGLRGKES